MPLSQIHTQFVCRHTCVVIKIVSFQKMEQKKYFLLKNFVFLRLEITSFLLFSFLCFLFLPFLFIEISLVKFSQLSYFHQPNYNNNNNSNNKFFKKIVQKLLVSCFKYHHHLTKSTYCFPSCSFFFC